MFRKFFLIFAALLLVFAPIARADMSDEATLGGQDSSGNYRFRVNSSGNLVGTKNIVFQSTLQASGVGSTESLSVPTGTTSVAPKSYAVVSLYVTTQTVTVGNGYAGQILFCVGEALTDTGTVTVTASTKTGWTSVALDSVNDSVTLLYVGDTTGWVIIGSNSVAIT